MVISEGSVSVFQNRTVPAAPDANRNGVPDRCEDARLRRGDANGDGVMDISDALHLLGGLFLGTAAPPCDKAADASDDGKLDVSDPILVLGVLFLDQGSIPEPAGRCGPDPTPDPLTCESFSGCP